MEDALEFKLAQLREQIEDHEAHVSVWKEKIAECRRQEKKIEGLLKQMAEVLA
jgi:hypothetical protein